MKTQRNQKNKTRSLTNFIDRFVCFSETIKKAMIVGVEGRPGGEKQILRFILYLKFSIRIACAKVNGRVNEPTQMFFFRLPVDEKFMYK